MNPDTETRYGLIRWGSSSPGSAAPLLTSAYGGVGCNGGKGDVVLDI